MIIAHEAPEWWQVHQADVYRYEDELGTAYAVAVATGDAIQAIHSTYVHFDLPEKKAMEFARRVVGNGPYNRFDVGGYELPLHVFREEYPELERISSVYYNRFTRQVCEFS